MASRRSSIPTKGSQFTSFAFTGRLQAAGIRVSMDGRGRCIDNIFIERLWRSLKYEAIYLHEVADGLTARRLIGEWVRFYNVERPHSALDGRTPAEVLWSPHLRGSDSSSSRRQKRHVLVNYSFSRGRHRHQGPHHLTFFLLLIWFAVSGYQIAEWAGTRDSVLLVIAIFACVVLHELGHALAARRYGISTPDITLLPIGGLARLSRMPEKPAEEVVIAIAGPLVNVVIAGVLFLLGADLSLDPERIVTYGDAFISQLVVINLYLFAFNLIPAFPMDGGRVLRALLAFRLGRGRATRIAARVGQGLAIVFALLGLVWGNVLLMLIAGFVFLAAGSESGATGLMQIAARLPLGRAIVRKYEGPSPQATIGDAADALLRTTQLEFPVVDGGGRMRGVVTVQRLYRRSRPTALQRRCWERWRVRRSSPSAHH